MVVGLKSRCDGLQLQESVRAELQRLVADAEQHWRTALQTAAQAELRTLSEDFDAQSQNTQSWIREKQQQLQTVGAQTPPEERSVAAQVGHELPRRYAQGFKRLKLTSYVRIRPAEHPDLKT